MKKIIINIDGGSRGNPGHAAIGVVFVNEKGEQLKGYGEYIGDNLTNNQAEYEAAIFALKKFKLLFGKELAKKSDIELRMDSELLYKQMMGEYKVKDPDIQQLFLKLWNAKVDFPKLKLKHVKRNFNTEPDRLLNEVLDQRMGEQKLL